MREHDEIYAWMVDVMTALPAKVLKRYEDNSVDVQLGINYIDTEGEESPRQTVFKVPLVFPASQKAVIAFPVDRGDSVLVVFCQRSLDNYKVNGSMSPSDRRMFDARDAVAIAGLIPFQKWKLPAAANDSVVVINNMGETNENSITLKSDGSVSIESPVKITMSAPVIESEGQWFHTTAGQRMNLGLHQHICAAPTNPSGTPIPIP